MPTLKLKQLIKKKYSVLYFFFWGQDQEAILDLHFLHHRRDLPFGFPMRFNLTIRKQNPIFDLKLCFLLVVLFIEKLRPNFFIREENPECLLEEKLTLLLPPFLNISFGGFKSNVYSRFLSTSLSCFRGLSKETSSSSY